MKGVAGNCTVAARLCKGRDVIAIDPSTTTLHMCSYLQNRKIIVVTTSISVALQFASSKSVDVILCGGMPESVRWLS